MGVLGLTSYIYDKSDLYFEDYRLMKCHFIIDGYSLASFLYNDSMKMNSAFGGDYDKYAKCIEKYFQNLKKCGVTPIVICDGGYERRKLNTVKKRLIERMFFLEKVTPTAGNRQCFPLMMRHVFREKILSMGILLLQSDCEADSEVAAVARKLDAPVLSSDSDFLIFDVKYIPMSSMPFDSIEKDENGHFYIPCLIYCIDNLLNNFNGVSKTMLPLLATVLGNDYINTSQFKNFYSQLRMDKSRKLRPGYKRVTSVLKWLKNENFDSAMNKILCSVKKQNRKDLKRKIKQNVKGYTDLCSPLEDYLPETIRSSYKETNQEMMELKEKFDRMNMLNEQNDDDPAEELDEEDDGEEEVVETYDEDLEEGLDKNQNRDLSDEEEFDSGDIPEWLLIESRKGNLCPAVLTLLNVRMFLCLPAVEDYQRPSSGNVAIPVLQVIAGLLGLPEVRYWSRIKRRYQSTLISSLASLPNFTHFPSLLYLPHLSLDQRKAIIFETLKIENQSKLTNFPPDWHLFLLSMIYWIKTNEDPTIKSSHIHAIIMMILIVNVIGNKVGFFWNKKTFLQKYGSKINVLKKKGLKTIPKIEFRHNTLIESIEKINFEECFMVFDLLMHYFHIDEVTSHKSRLFSQTTIHIYSQLQYCFDLAVTLNSLLLLPFDRCHLGNFYNGTLLYNFTINFKKRPNIMSYIENLFEKYPTILNFYRQMYSRIEELIPALPEQKIKPKKPRVRKIKVQKGTPEEQSSEQVSDTDIFEDENNPFCLLNNRVKRLLYCTGERDSSECESIRVPLSI